MGAFSDSSIDGDVYIQRLATYIRRNEEALANGLLGFSKNKSNNKGLRLNFTIHHLYYIIERLDTSGLGVEVGPLNIKLDTPNHEPTFISFMANNARSKHFDSDTRSISSINSMKSIVSSASIYLRSSFNFTKDPKIIIKDLKYLYSSFTKIPCLVLTPKTKVGSIASYEEYPCDTSVPIKMFKNLQVLELNSYEPNEIVGWHLLSDQLRILIIRNCKISELSEVLFNLVIDDEFGRSSFNIHKKKNDVSDGNNDHLDPIPVQNIDIHHINSNFNNGVFKRDDKVDYLKKASFEDERKFDNDNMIPISRSSNKRSHSRSRSSTIGAGSDNSIYEIKDYTTLSDSNWFVLKQLTVTETSISSIPNYIFKPLSNLVKLNLSSNLLEELPQGLNQLHNIKYINFADNYIKTLNNLPKNLENLTTLNFNNNKLVDLKGLQNLARLEKIDLRRNQISDIKKLKHLILLYIKCPQFSNVYLANNKLPKNYRIDLFNLFNGVKYKNSVKIDDTRPGYFELALLLDSEAAFKYLESFFRHKSRRSSVLTVTKAEEANLVESIENMKIDEETTLNSSSNLEQKIDENTNIPINSTLEVLKSNSNPLSNNFNVINTLESSSYTSKSNSIPTIASPTTIKKSTTFNTGLDSIAAPNIVTQVLVTARMST